MSRQAIRNKIPPRTPHPSGPGCRYDGERVPNNQYTTRSRYLYWAQYDADLFTNEETSRVSS